MSVSEPPLCGVGGDVVGDALSVSPAPAAKGGAASGAGATRGADSAGIVAGIGGGGSINEWRGFPSATVGGMFVGFAVVGWLLGRSGRLFVGMEAGHQELLHRQGDMRQPQWSWLVAWHRLLIRRSPSRRRELDRCTGLAHRGFEGFRWRSPATRLLATPARCSPPEHHCLQGWGRVG